MKSAWAKARHYSSIESLEDRIERHLYDSDTNNKLEVLKRSAVCQSVGPQYDVHYDEPKGTGATRPKCFSRLNDLILSVAGCLSFAGKYQDLAQNMIDKVAFGYKLNRNPYSEYLYDYWLPAHKQYREKAYAALSDYDKFLVTDVRQYYNSIMHPELNKRARALCSRCNESSCHMIRLISRKCYKALGPLKGIPQGHPVSGFWANAYLLPVDEHMLSNWNGSFFRYVDDITLVGASGVEDGMFVELEDSCEALGLELHKSPPKFFVGSVGDYLDRYSADAQLDSLSKTGVALAQTLYLLYRKESIRAPRQTAEIYSSCLRSIRIHISPRWLQRKLGLKSVARLRLIIQNRSIPVPRGPELPKTTSDTEIETWRKTFDQLNREWCEKTDNYRMSLANLLEISLERLGDGIMSRP